MSIENEAVAQLRRRVAEPKTSSLPFYKLPDSPELRREMSLRQRLIDTYSQPLPENENERRQSLDERRKVAMDVSGVYLNEDHAIVDPAMWDVNTKLVILAWRGIDVTDWNALLEDDDWWNKNGRRRPL